MCILALSRLRGADTARDAFVPEVDLLNLPCGTLSISLIPVEDAALNSILVYL